MTTQGGGDAAAKIEKLNVAKSKSKLAKPIQELIALIFDIEVMKKAMVEFEVSARKSLYENPNFGFVWIFVQTDF